MFSVRYVYDEDWNYSGHWAVFKDDTQFFIDNFRDEWEAIESLRDNYPEAYRELVEIHSSVG